MKKFILVGFLAFMVVGFISNFAQASSSNDVQQIQYEMLTLVNQERTRYGLKPLVLDSSLIAGAMIRAKEIAEVFSHTRPDGRSCFTVLGNYRKSRSALGENISAGRASLQETNDSWMRSSGHRANILNPRFRALGVGYYYDANSQYGFHWVQMFKS